MVDAFKYRIKQKLLEYSYKELSFQKFSFYFQESKSFFKKNYKSFRKKKLQPLHGFYHLLQVDFV